MCDERKQPSRENSDGRVRPEQQADAALDKIALWSTHLIVCSPIITGSWDDATSTTPQ